MVLCTEFLIIQLNSFDREACEFFFERAPSARRKTSSNGITRQLLKVGADYGIQKHFPAITQAFHELADSGMRGDQTEFHEALHVALQ